MGTRARGAKGEGVDYKRFLLSRLQKGAQRVRGADISTGVALILSIWVCYLLLAVMLDQVLVLPPMLRLALLLASGSASLAIAFWWIVRPLTSTVNSLYTARTLESAKPDIKNSFVNWAELSKKQDDIPDVIMKTIESRAAQEISKVKVEDAIQPRLVLPALYTMSAVVILFCLFTRFTSKDLFSSFQRILLPLAELRPPTSTELRISFDPSEKAGTEPAPLPAGAAITVKAMLVRGKPDSITAYVRAEGTEYDEPHNLSPTGATNEFVLTLPKRQKTFDLTVLAGDYRSRTYRVVVTAAPMITDWLLTYTPPAYTGEASFNSTQPDIDGLEGTKVRIEATSNLPVKRTGAIMELMDQTIDMSLVDGSAVKLAGEMTLKRDGTYRVKFQDAQSRSPEFRPIHQIRVRVDQPPRIEFVSPSLPESEWPADQPLTIHAKLSDDFGIRRARLVVGKSDGDEAILDQEKGGPGELLGRALVWKEQLTPELMNGKPGDILEYWIEATDSKLPLSNDVSTRADRRRIKLVAPAERKENDSTRPSGKERQPREIAKGDSPKDAEKPAKGEPTPGESSSDESPVAQRSAKEDSSIDADGKESPSNIDDVNSDDGTPSMDSKDGAALDKLQKYFEKSREDSNSTGSPQDAKHPEDSLPNEQAEKADDASSGSTTGVESEGEKGSPGDSPKGADASAPENQRGSDAESEQQSSSPPSRSESAGEESKQGNAASQQGDSPSGQQNSSAGQQESGSSSKGNEGRENQPPDGTPSNGGESRSKPPSSNGSSNAGKEQGELSEGKQSSADQQGNAAEQGESGDKGASPTGSEEGKESPEQGDGPPKPEGTGSKNAPRSSKQGKDNASASPDGNTDGSASQAESGTPDPKGDGEQAAGQDGKPDSVTRRPTGEGSEEPSTSSSSESSEGSGKGSSPSSEGDQASGGESKQGSKEGSSDQKGTSSESGSSSSKEEDSSDGKGSGEGPTKNAGQSAGSGKGSSKAESPPSTPGDADPKKAGKSSSKEGGSLQQGGEPSDNAGSASEPAPSNEVNDNLGESANSADKEKGSNLVLRRLEEELRQKKVDPALLKEMGWTEEDAKKFAERMRAEATKGEEKSDPLNQAKREGFGQGTDLRKSTGRSAGKGADQLQDLFSGRRTPPPSEVRKRYEAYMRSLSAEGIAPVPSENQSQAPIAAPAPPKNP